MQEIEKLRAELDQIHGEFRKLMKRRLTIARKIWELKKSQNLPLIDSQRENTLIHQFDSMSSDAAEKTAMQNLFKGILTETKTYLETKLK